MKQYPLCLLNCSECIILNPRLCLKYIICLEFNLVTKVLIKAIVFVFTIVLNIKFKSRMSKMNLNKFIVVQYKKLKLYKNYTVFSLKICHSKYSSPARNLSKYILIADEFPICNIRHIALIIRQTGRAFQYFVARDGHSLRAAVFVPG